MYVNTACMDPMGNEMFVTNIQSLRSISPWDSTGWRRTSEAIAVVAPNIGFVGLKCEL